MNRRNFLSLVALGAPAAVIAPKLGVIARHAFQNGGASSGICEVCGGIMPAHEFVLVGTMSRRMRIVDPREGDMGRGSLPGKLSTPFAFRTES